MSNKNKNTEGPKVGETWECVGNVWLLGTLRFTKGENYNCNKDGHLTDNYGVEREISGMHDYRLLNFRKVSENTKVPLYWIMNADCPNMGYKKGEIIMKHWRTNLYYGDKKDLIHIDLLPHVATPFYATPFTLESGDTIHITEADEKKLRELFKM